MAFRDFTFPKVLSELGLTLTDRDLYGAVAPLEPEPEFEKRMRVNVPLGVGGHNEKARSEFIIAPVLLELKYRFPDRFGLFSGFPLDIDASRGLNGICDFLLTRTPTLSVLRAPILAVVEAKNDTVHDGLGQRIAATVAARVQRDGAAPPRADPRRGHDRDGLALPPPRRGRTDARHQRVRHRRTGPHPGHLGAHRRLTGRRRVGQEPEA
jgi:hypothetical protein